MKNGLTFSPVLNWKNLLKLTKFNSPRPTLKWTRIKLGRLFWEDPCECWLHPQLDSHICYTRDWFNNRSQSKIIWIHYNNVCYEDYWKKAVILMIITQKIEYRYYLCSQFEYKNRRIFRWFQFLFRINEMKCLIFFAIICCVVPIWTAPNQTFITGATYLLGKTCGSVTTLIALGIGEA